MVIATAFLFNTFQQFLYSKFAEPVTNPLNLEGFAWTKLVKLYKMILMIVSSSGVSQKRMFLKTSFSVPDNSISDRSFHIFRKNWAFHWFVVLFRMPQQIRVGQLKSDLVIGCPLFSTNSYFQSQGSQLNYLSRHVFNKEKLLCLDERTKPYF